MGDIETKTKVFKFSRGEMGNITKHNNFLYDKSGNYVGEVIDNDISSGILNEYNLRLL